MSNVSYTSNVTSLNTITAQSHSSSVEQDLGSFEAAPANEKHLADSTESPKVLALAYVGRTLK